MDASRFNAARPIFEQASSLEGEARDAFIERECGTDAALRLDVELLLGVTPHPQFLEPPRPLEPGTLGEADSERALPKSIGPYRILGRIGAGGMGVVYEAQQEQPQRRVAVKVLRVSLADESTARRFQSEAEFLARLNHPSIAQIYEAGLHREEDGTSIPFLALEFVESARDLESYCRQEQVSLRDRVSLVARIADAVHHGHQKGVVHRDLKPANLLVNQSGAPKVIDFGVARAIEEESNAQTRTGSLIGTPAYMAPEQLEGLPADTGSDVYALGVIAHELFFDCSPRSVRGKTPTRVAQILRTEPLREPAELRGNEFRELWWIVAAALETEPSRRTASASELAADLRRYLRGEPVLAGAPNTLYRLRKFVSRHRVVASATVLSLLAILVGSAALFVGLRKARAESQRANSVNEVLEDVLIGSRLHALGPQASALDLLDRAARRLGARSGLDPDVEARVTSVLARSYLDFGANERALPLAQRSLELYEARLPADAEARLNAAYLAGTALFHSGELARTDTLLAGIREVRAKTPVSTEHPSLLSLGLLEGLLLDAKGDSLRAASVLMETRNSARSAFGPEHDETLVLEASMTRILGRAGRIDEALEIAAHVRDAKVGKWGADHANSLPAQFSYAQMLIMGRRFAEALPLLEGLAEDFSSQFGREHPDTLTTKTTLANLYTMLGRPREAVPILEEVLATRREIAPSDFTPILLEEGQLARALIQAGEERGEEAARKSLAGRIELLGERHPSVADALFLLGRFTRRRGRLDESETLLLSALSIREELFGRQHPDTIEARAELAVLAFNRSDPVKSVELWEQVRPDWESVFAVGSPLDTSYRWSYGCALHSANRSADGARELQIAIEGFRNQLPRGSAQLGTCLETLSVLENAAGMQEESLAHLTEALAIYTDRFSEEDPRVVRLRSKRAVDLERAGRFEEALPLLEALVAQPELHESIRPGVHAVHLDTLEACLRGLGRGEEEIAERMTPLRAEFRQD